MSKNNIFQEMRGAASKSKNEPSSDSGDSDESSDSYSTPSPEPKSKNRTTVFFKKKPVLPRQPSLEIPTIKKAKYDSLFKKSHARFK